MHQRLNGVHRLIKWFAKKGRKYDVFLSSVSTSHSRKG
ncbi:hypothetical protein RB2083_3393 [Rhodobacteraceae bacterium HTCC2083]|nr:hypothetical protein RB2083_3393 [Rhodobacteraceae bacterium HTCC2083]